MFAIVLNGDLRWASDLSLAVTRLARQLRFRRPESPVTRSQLCALATLANDGAMPPGTLAVSDVLLRAADPMALLVDEDA